MLDFTGVLQVSPFVLGSSNNREHNPKGKPRQENTRKFILGYQETNGEEKGLP